MSCAIAGMIQVPMNKRMIPIANHFLFIDIPPLMKIKYPSLYKIFLSNVPVFGDSNQFLCFWTFSPGKNREKDAGERI
jgi:hypothetical protein